MAEDPEEDKEPAEPREPVEHHRGKDLETPDHENENEPVRTAEKAAVHPPDSHGLCLCAEIRGHQDTGERENTDRPRHKTARKDTGNNKDIRVPVDRMVEEIRDFNDFQAKLNDTEKGALRLEIEKLRRVSLVALREKYREVFAEETPWIHLDIAGMAWVDDARPYIAKGPSGVAVRSILEWVRKF